MAIDPTTLFPGAAGDREGAILKIRPENLWQDTAGTTAVTTDGDPVRRIDDISVNGRGFLILNTSVPFTYHTDGTVHWLTASGAANSGLINDVDWTFMSGNPYSVGAAVSFDTPADGDQYIFSTEPASGGSLNNSRVHAGVRDGTTLTIAHWFGDANFSHTTAAATAKRHILEYKNPGAEYTIDGTSIGSNGSSPGSLDEVGEARIFNGIGIPTDGNIYGIIIVIDTITAQEKADIDEWLQEQIEGPSGVTGSGALEAQRATVSGTGTITKTGTGSLEAQRATVSGSGTVFSTITGTGSLEAQRATVSGAGLLDIAHVNSTKAVAASSSVTSITTNKPAGAAEDDFALFVTSADGGVGITLPTGVTEVFQGDVPSSAVGPTRIAVGYKILGPSEPADYTSTLSSNDGCTMSCSVWRNVDTSTPLDVAFDHTVVNSSVDPCPPCPSVTTISDRVALITLASAPRGPSFEDMLPDDMYTPPGGVTEVVDANYAAGTSYAGHGIGWEIIAEAGATGTRTWSYIDNDEGGFAGTLALRQAGATITSDKTGSGTLEAQRATTSGTGTIGRDATGTLEAQRATVSGSGNVTGNISGSGSLEAQRATITGSGSTSDAETTGSGSLEAQRATVSGTGKITKTGSGSLEAQRATLEGLGTAFGTITGSGSLEASRAVMEATGEAYKSAAGALVASRATMSGTGTVDLAPITGSGTLQASNAVVTATIKRTISGAGTLSASQASLSVFLWIELNPQEPLWIEQDTPDNGQWS